MSVSVEQRRGSVDNPLSATEAEQKFRRLAATSLREPEVDEVIELVQRMEREPGVERLMSLLTRSSARKS
jgi:2-methylcitrate dehydratase PrpD